MSSGGSQKFIGRNRAPRVQIEYDTETGDAKKKVQLPFVMAVMSDLKGKLRDGEEAQPLADRSFDNVDAGSLNKYMRGVAPHVNFTVDDKLSGDEDKKLNVDITFASMDDFSPGAIAETVPELKKILEARNQLKNLLSMMDGREKDEDLIENVLNNPALLESLKSTDPDALAAKHAKEVRKED